MLKLRQVCSGFITNDRDLIELKTEKLEILKELIESYEDNKKLVIFAEFKYSIKTISSLLERLKVKYVVLDGDQKNKTYMARFSKRQEY